MENCRVIFMGTPIFACGILQTLIDEKYNVVAVVSQPDKKVGRKQIVTPTPVKQLALEHNIPVIQPISIKEDYEEVLSYKPDLIVTCAYGQFVPSIILKAPKYGSINVHASLLPKYRGGAPIHKAIINGESVTGVTIMEMIAKMDAGRMYAKEEVVIEEDDTTDTLHDKLVACGKHCLKEMLPDYLSGKIEGIPQNEEEATFAYNISKEEEYISFNRDVNVVYNHIRGLIDWPTGYGMIENKRLKIYKARKIVKSHTEESGKIVSFEDNGFKVACENGYILILECQIEGKKRMTSDEFYRGYGKMLIGKNFE